jgi:hypothetical protein
MSGCFDGTAIAENMSGKSQIAFAINRSEQGVQVKEFGNERK